MRSTPGSAAQRAEIVYRGANRLGLGLLRALDVRVRVTGSEHVPLSGPVVLASTHISYLDFLLVEYAARPRGRFVRFMCRHDVWNRPAVARAMDSMRHVPVDRESSATTYLRALRLLESGEAVGTFPEAGLSHSFIVRPLMPGAAGLASRTGAPLLPVVLWGSQRLTTVDHTPLRRGRLVDVVVGEPLPVEQGADPRETTARLGARLQGMLDDVQRLPEHRPESGGFAWWHPRHLGGHAPDLAMSTRRNPMPHTAVAVSWRPRDS